MRGVQKRGHDIVPTDARSRGRDGVIGGGGGGERERERERETTKREVGKGERESGR